MLNEPTEGIDIRVRRELYDTLGGLARENKSILIASGDVDEILTVSDRILVMVKGRIVGEFITAKTNKREILECMLQPAETEVSA
jgi:ABC-type sugar transport system ATPase subunit